MTPSSSQRPLLQRRGALGGCSDSVHEACTIGVGKTCKLCRVSCKLALRKYFPVFASLPAFALCDHLGSSHPHCIPESTHEDGRMLISLVFALSPIGPQMWVCLKVVIVVLCDEMLQRSGHAWPQLRCLQSFGKFGSIIAACGCSSRLSSWASSNFCMQCCKSTYP